MHEERAQRPLKTRSATRSGRNLLTVSPLLTNTKHKKVTCPTECMQNSPLPAEANQSMISRHWWHADLFPAGSAQLNITSSGVSCPEFRRPVEATRCDIERDEHWLVEALVSPAHTVMELGGRFGTTSCALSQATNNSGAVLVIEPDNLAWPYLHRNRWANLCSFAVWAGSISSEGVVVHREPTHGGYGTRSSAAGNKTRSVPNLSFFDAEQKLGRPINALLIDCEGCIGTLLSEAAAPRILDGLDLILLEHDQPQYVGYGRFFDLFRHHGLEQIWLAQDKHNVHEHEHSGSNRCITVMLSTDIHSRSDLVGLSSISFCRPWSRLLKHSAWKRVRNLPAAHPAIAEDPEARLKALQQTCPEYRARRNLSSDMLRCLDPSDDDAVGRLVNATAHAQLDIREVERLITQTHGRAVYGTMKRLQVHGGQKSRAFTLGTLSREPI